jgi:hypothetical protein
LNKIFNRSATTILIFTLLCIMLFSSAKIYAVDELVEDGEQPLINISAESSDEIGICGSNIPSSVWDISIKGKYVFSGNASSQMQYTDYRFKGKTSYIYYVKNTGRKNLTVKAKSHSTTYRTTTIKPGQSTYTSFSGISGTTRFYLSFSGSSFSGHII